MASTPLAGYTAKSAADSRVRAGCNKIIASRGVTVASCSHAVVGQQADGSAGRAAVERMKTDVLVMSRCRLQVYYSGRVQGVGFRYTVKSIASGFEVTGTVRNLPDTRVELVVEGVKDELTAFQRAIRESELGHFIQQEDLVWEEPRGGFRGFEIAR
jgi:acylphosphatase